METQWAQNTRASMGNRRSVTNPAFQLKLKQMALPLAPLVQLTTGLVHPAFPATLLSFWLLTDDQLDALATFYHQRTPCRWTLHYPCPISWPRGLSIEEKRRKIGKFIGLRGCETPPPSHPLMNLHTFDMNMNPMGVNNNNTMETNGQGYEEGEGDDISELDLQDYEMDLEDDTDVDDMEMEDLEDSCSDSGDSIITNTSDMTGMVEGGEGGGYEGGQFAEGFGGDGVEGTGAVWTQVDKNTYLTIRRLLQLRTEEEIVDQARRARLSDEEQIRWKMGWY
ncbi:hypothetical protein QBC46DRAFT_76464 [Diplogelasinospora grovesii]|uniref:Uncharacterized protein n=1 Tax=Diplogelasinospora grovesii TaxID=303347 RepID=A0AAN6MVY8_9PEZI|nr:hypothetical protein QBC46DRAFT_76464 [Diplogelasinospora grovesii]